MVILKRFIGKEIHHFAIVYISVHSSTFFELTHLSLKIWRDFYSVDAE